MMDILNLSDTSEELKKTPMVDFTGRFFLSRELASTMPNISTLARKFARHDENNFDEILATLKMKLQL